MMFSIFVLENERKKKRKLRSERVVKDIFYTNRADLEREKYLIKFAH